MRVHPTRLVRNSILGAILIVLSQAAPAAPEQTSPTNQMPAWLTDVSLTAKESYDDNVFMSGVPQALVPAGTTTLKDRSSFITTASPRIGLDLAALPALNGDVKTLSLVYAPDFVRYHSLPSENYDAHKFLTTVKAAGGPISVTLDNTITFVDASKTAPAYPGSLLNAWATISAYPRREQLQDRSKFSIQYDLGDWFIRPNATAAYYAMMTDIKDTSAAGTPSGYQNYATRYDVNGGADLGYRFSSTMAVTLGYRYGSQGQEQYWFTKDSSPSDYQRVLLGLEGKPCDWLSVQIQGGPDFRDYAPDTATHITPVNDHHPVKYYGEATIAAKLSPNDTLTVKYRQFQFVSCLGKVPYFDSSYDLSYSRKLTSQLSLDLGGKVLSADYTSGNLSTCRRDDWDFALSAGAKFAFNRHFSASLSYSADLGRNELDGVANPGTRDFDRQLVSLAAQFKF